MGLFPLELSRVCTDDGVDNVSHHAHDTFAKFTLQLRRGPRQPINECKEFIEKTMGATVLQVEKDTGDTKFYFGFSSPRECQTIKLWVSMTWWFPSWFLYLEGLH